MSLTPEQIALRRKGITATDAAKILGSSPWGKPIDVVMDKLGDAAEFVETDRTKWGNILEGPIRDDFATRHGVMIADAGTLVHSNGWAMATPDGMVVVGGERLHPTMNFWTGGDAVAGLEIKTHSSRMGHLYGEPGTDEVPPWVYVQAAWNIYVARDKYGDAIDRWWVVAFIDGVPQDYLIHRDADLETCMVDQCHAFHVKHIINRELLDPDGSVSYDNFLQRRHPINTLPITGADESAMAAIEKLKATRAEYQRLCVALSEAQQAVKLIIGDHEGIEFPSGGKTEKITWKKSKPSIVTDWRTAFALLAVHTGIAPSVGDAIAGHATSERDGSRRLLTPKSWGNEQSTDNK